MSHLRNALADYLTLRRALGYKMDKADRFLGQFVAFAEDRGETPVRTETALAWATLPAPSRSPSSPRVQAGDRDAQAERGHRPFCQMHRPPAELQVRPQPLAQSGAAHLIAGGPSTGRVKIHVDRSVE
tara:strand:+ start:5094 stop:5477 length:384 start_codon:yes stop_codon:yes gene_type:complete